GQEMHARMTVHIKLSCIKINIIPMGEGLRMQVSAHLNRHAILMDPNLREVDPKGIFHLPQYSLRQWTTRTFRSRKIILYRILWHIPDGSRTVYLPLYGIIPLLLFRLSFQVDRSTTFRLIL